MSKTIPLTKGMQCLVSEEDFDYPIQNIENPS